MNKCLIRRTFSQQFLSNFHKDNLHPDQCSCCSKSISQLKIYFTIVWSVVLFDIFDIFFQVADLLIVKRKLLVHHKKLKQDETIPFLNCRFDRTCHLSTNKKLRLRLRKQRFASKHLWVLVYNLGLIYSSKVESKNLVI